MMIVLCSHLLLATPNVPSVTESAQWSDAMVLGGATAAYFTVHAQKDTFLNWEWSNTTTNLSFKQDTVPTRTFYVWSAALALAAGLESGSKEAIAVLQSFSVTGLATELLKYSFARPRPDFEDRMRIATDTNNEKLIRDAKLSLPSGHSSSAFGLALHTSLWLHRTACRRGWGQAVVVTGYMLPLALATGIGITRVSDHRHNTSDVIAGAAVGLGVSYGINRWQFGPMSTCTQP